MSESSLVSYRRILPYKYKGTKTKNDLLLPHCMAGNLSLKTCGDVLAKNHCSVQYGIDSKGNIAQYLSESSIAIATSNYNVDKRGVSIEIANAGRENTSWHMSDKALESFVKLSVDICKRNGIKELTWLNDKSKVGRGQNIALHRYYAKKACPGDYFISKLPYLVGQINMLLNSGVTSPFYYRGVDYSPVFDPNFYNTEYPDLANVYHGDAVGLWNHFCAFGMNEARKAHKNFDPKVYRARYPDLNAVYGDNWTEYYYHYIVCGISEGRIAV